MQTNGYLEMEQSLRRLKSLGIAYKAGLPTCQTIPSQRMPTLHSRLNLWIYRGGSRDERKTTETMSMKQSEEAAPEEDGIDQVSSLLTRTEDLDLLVG
jgi:hypothetical protein